MTEMGLGGAVDCRVRGGGHIREADLLVEIIDPVSGQPLPDGEAGEVVFTTLTRSGMPLIRYRSGDLSRIIPESCPCGTMLKRLDHVAGRLAGQVRLSDGDVVSMADLDEALFPLPGLRNFKAEISEESGMNILQITLLTDGGPAERLCRAVREALSAVPLLQRTVAAGLLRIAPLAVVTENIWLSSGSIKRTILDRRENKPC
jgi:phenylacetate-coenzyme A ligase PaaK-like adenylate-forming protein